MDQLKAEVCSYHIKEKYKGPDHVFMYLSTKNHFSLNKIRIRHKVIRKVLNLI